MAHTVEETAISWNRPVSEGVHFAYLMEGTISMCGSRARVREGRTRLISVG